MSSHNPAEPVQLTMTNTAETPITIPKSSAKASYAFVDAVRFFATLGIVYIHTYVPMKGMQTYTFLRQVNHPELYLYVKQLFKFATICYFLIAGFLMGDKSIDSSPFQYYMRRFNGIAKPYVLALVVFIAASAIYSCLTTGQHISLKYLFAVAQYIMLYSPFWYIPNYLLCLLVIVCFY